ncbi:SusC/RagA family TonB-linked outer membrane protein [Butyricimonas hominis]|uniref:SusC/RagA family TonB-linked outer membrane protein n=1 Tax=Butyricimonas hominis TaxID=2763032 RepID=UPI0035115750
MEKNQKEGPEPLRYRSWKLYTVMRLTLLMNVFFVLFSFGNGFSQKRVTIDLGETTIKEALVEFQRQTNKIVIYSDEHLANDQRVVLNCKDVELEECLKLILKGSGMTYRFEDDYILIVPLKVSEQDSTKTVAKVVISGVVKDTEGLPLPGVTVLLKGMKLGTSTNSKGEFTLEIPKVKDKEIRLVFSFIGLRTKEVIYKENEQKTPWVIVMEEDIRQLGEVTVSTGYQTVNRKDMVGAYTTVRASDIMQPVYTSVDQMLQGRVAGMIVMNTSSRVGTNPKIQIRGTSTILGNQDPLWVVDGIIQPDPLPLDVSSTMTEDLKNVLGNQISWLNPSDIETITVLKDASATAIYGSKASNGVIVITTKKSKTDRLSVNYTANFSFKQKPSYGMFNMMNSRERIDYSKEAYENGGRFIAEPVAQTSSYEGLMRLVASKEITIEEYGTYLERLETVNTDWFDILTQNGFSHNHNLSLMGGSEKVTYNLSFNFSDDQGQEIGNSAKKMGLRLRVGAQLLKNLNVDASVILARGDNRTFGPGVNPMEYAKSTSRALPAYDENGAPLYYLRSNPYAPAGKDILYSYNFENERDNSYAKAFNMNTNASLNLNWDVTSWFRYELVLGYTEVSNTSKSFAGEQTYHIASKYRGYDYGTAEPGSDEFKSAMLPFGGEYMTSYLSNKSYSIQNKFVFSKTFNEDHRLNAMAGIEVRSEDADGTANTVWGYTPDRGNGLVAPTGLKQLVTAETPKDWGILQALYSGGWKETDQVNNYLSLFATVAYSYKDKYVFNANIRSDASNAFGQDVNKRMDPTYSFGVSWRMAEEPFIKNHISWLNQLNFRATYGVQGNSVNTVSPEMILGRYSTVFKPFNEYGAGIRSLPNPNLKWERTKSWNLGFDLQLFNGITMNLEYYGRSSDAIVAQKIPEEYGISSMNINGGRITNHGVEYSVHFTPFQRKDFAWTIGINSSKNWNKGSSVNEVSTPDLSEYLSGSSSRVLKKGYPISAIWSFSFAGLDPETGYPTFNYMDFEETDSKMDPTEYLVYSGQTDPYFTGGLNTRLRYKDVSFGADFSVLLGGKKRLPSLYSGERGSVFMPDPFINVDKEIAKRWREPGDENKTKVPAIYTSSNFSDYWVKRPDGGSSNMYEMWDKSDFRVVSASFLRCTQMSLTWRVSGEWCKKLYLTNLSISAYVNNVFVIASKKFNGFDPELGNSVMPRTYSLGINIGF